MVIVYLRQSPSSQRQNHFLTVIHSASRLHMAIQAPTLIPPLTTISFPSVCGLTILGLVTSLVHFAEIKDDAAEELLPPPSSLVELLETGAIFRVDDALDAERGSDVGADLTRTRRLWRDEERPSRVWLEVRICGEMEREG